MADPTPVPTDPVLAAQKLGEVILAQRTAMLAELKLDPDDPITIEALWAQFATLALSGGGSVDIAALYQELPDFSHIGPDLPLFVLTKADFEIEGSPVAPPNAWEELEEYFYIQRFPATISFTPKAAPQLDAFLGLPDGEHVFALYQGETLQCMPHILRSGDHVGVLFDVTREVDDHTEYFQFACATAAIPAGTFSPNDPEILPGLWLLKQDAFYPATIEDFGIIQADGAAKAFPGFDDAMGMLFEASTLGEIKAAGLYAQREDGNEKTYEFIRPSLGGSAAITPADVIAAISAAPGVSLMTDDQVLKLAGIQEGAQPNPPIAQSTGPSPVAVMSQAAVTQALASAGGGGASPAGLSLALEMAAARFGAQMYNPIAPTTPAYTLSTIVGRELFVECDAPAPIAVQTIDPVWPYHKGQVWLSKYFTGPVGPSASETKCDVTLVGSFGNVDAQICVGRTAQTMSPPPDPPVFVPGVLYAWVGGVTPFYQQDKTVYYAVSVQGAVALTLPGMMSPVSFPAAGIYTVTAGGIVFDTATDGTAWKPLVLAKPLECDNATLLGYKAFLRSRECSFVVQDLKAGLYLVRETALMQAELRLVSPDPGLLARVKELETALDTLGQAAEQANPPQG